LEWRPKNILAKRCSMRRVYVRVKRDLLIRQKRPIYMTKEAC